MAEFYNTKNKGVLLNFLKENKDSSFTAKELLNLIPNIPKATIYRKLEALSISKEIRKSFNESKQAIEYQYSDNCNNHLHLKCLKCNKLIHLDCIKADSLIEHINNSHGFKINLNNSTIYGLCKECE